GVWAGARAVGEQGMSYRARPHRPAMVLVAICCNPWYGSRAVGTRDGSGRERTEGRMAELRIRPARHEDAAAIAEIYNQGIRGRMATFETEERTVEDRERWLAAHDQRHPCLV